MIQLPVANGFVLIAMNISGWIGRRQVTPEFLQNTVTQAMQDIFLFFLDSSSKFLPEGPIVWGGSKNDVCVCVCVCPYDDDDVCLFAQTEIRV